jgi:transcriptional regulator with XRE-family HTH domain
MTQEEKQAILALKDFMAALGATQQEIEKELNMAMEKDPNMTPEKMREVRKLLNFTSAPEKKDISNLSKPGVLKPLNVTLKELKSGRPTQDQHLLDEFIKEIEELESDRKVILRIKQKLALINADVKMLSYRWNKEFLFDLIEEINDEFGK